MEKALRELGVQRLAKTEHLHESFVLVHESSALTRAAGSIPCVEISRCSKLMVAAKGAPEAIADLCHLDPQHLQGILQHKRPPMAGEGLRSWGSRVGQPVAQSDLPREQHDLSLRFIGLLGLADPIRPTVPQAIQECYSAGIRVVMITGDLPSHGTKVSDGRLA